MLPDESAAARRLSDLRRAQPADATLQNLLGVLSAKLDLCSRLPIFEYEADVEGHDSVAAAFRDLADVERKSFEVLARCLRGHLDSTLTSAQSAQAPQSGPRRGAPGGGRR